MESMYSCNSIEPNSDDESLDFEDLSCNDQKYISKNKIPLNHHQSEDHRNTPTNNQIDFISFQQHSHIVKTKNQEIKQLQTIKQFLQKQNNYIETQYHSLMEKYKLLTQQLNNKDRQIALMMDSISSISLEKQTLTHQLNIKQNQIQALLQKRNQQNNQYECKVQSALQQVEYYQQKEDQLRQFLKRQYKINISPNKTLKTIINSIVAQLYQQINQIYKQVQHVYLNIDTNQPHTQYNHLVCLNKIHKIEQYIIISKHKTNTKQ